MVGFLALTGIIVNDSLILVDFIKRLRAKGMERMQAVVESGRVRIRPILLTTITTFLGISPLIFFSTGQTRFLAPMAVSLGFGLVFATALILIVVIVVNRIGRIVYLGDVADIQKGRGLNAIERRDNQRLAVITAEVDDRETTSLEVTKLIEEKFGEESSGYHLLFLGEKKEAADSMKDMKAAMIIALAIIFFILASLFKSLLDPFVVMLAIPFGMIGVIFGHMLFNYHLQFLSMVGFLALTGIIVNDSLILVDFIKRLRAKGMERMQAVVESGRVRIRPILLTTITTFLGISPLIFFSTGQTRFLAPMAVSLGFGLVFATALILIVVPCFYLIADDIRTFTHKKLRTRHE